MYFTLICQEVRVEVGISEAANFGLFVGIQRYGSNDFCQKSFLILAAEPHADELHHLESWGRLS